jgi:hypothetical protein
MDVLQPLGGRGVLAKRREFCVGRREHGVGPTFLEGTYQRGLG